jgi:hypothetical protein
VVVEVLHPCPFKRRRRRPSGGLIHIKREDAVAIFPNANHTNQTTMKAAVIFLLSTLVALVAADPIPMDKRGAFVAPVLGALSRDALKLERARALTNEFRAKKASGRVTGISRWDLRDVAGKNYSEHCPGGAAFQRAFLTPIRLRSRSPQRSGWCMRHLCRF